MLLERYQAVPQDVDAARLGNSSLRGILEGQRCAQRGLRVVEELRTNAYPRVADQLKKLPIPRV